MDERAARHDASLDEEPAHVDILSLRLAFGERRIFDGLSCRFAHRQISCILGGPNLLYVNQGDGTFVEDAAGHGLVDALGRRTISGGFADYDQDGRPEAGSKSYFRPV